LSNFRSRRRGCSLVGVPGPACQDLAFIIDSAPKKHPLAAADLQHHLVEMLAARRFGPYAPPCLVGVALRLTPPAPEADVAKVRIC
jgi:hypothetical protein